MARWTRSGLVFAGGLLAGMLVVNIVNIIGYWHGGMPGGEIVGLLMIPLLLYAGCIIGQERKQPKTYQRGYRKGYQVASSRPISPVNQAIKPRLNAADGGHKPTSNAE